MTFSLQIPPKTDMLNRDFSGALLPAAMLLLLANLLATASQASLLRRLTPQQRAAALQQLQEIPDSSAFVSQDDVGVLPAYLEGLSVVPTLTCPDGFHNCTGKCVNNLNVNTCGKRCTPCPIPPNGSSRCRNATCAIVCNTGFKITTVAGNRTCTPKPGISPSPKPSPSPSPKPSPSPSPNATRCPPTQGWVKERCRKCPEGHPGDGFTCPTPPCSAGKATAVTEDGCWSCGTGASDGWKCLESICPGGYFVTQSGTCRGCAAGTVSHGDKCTPCPPGTYQASARQMTCIPAYSVDWFMQMWGMGYGVFYATTGKMCPEAGSTSPCETSCSDPTQASRNGINCTDCANVPGFGLQDGKCEPCAPGTYADDTMATCQKCPAGTSTDGRSGFSRRRSEVGQVLSWTCFPCGPTYSIYYARPWPDRGRPIAEYAYGGGFSEEGAAHCTPCDNAPVTGGFSNTYSWRGLACNATCADIPGWGEGYQFQWDYKLEDWAPFGDLTCRPCPVNTTSKAGEAVCTKCTTVESLPVYPGSTECNNASYTGRCGSYAPRGC